MRKGCSCVLALLALSSFAAFPMGEVMERGGLAHQSNASLIVAPMWVSVGERMMGSGENEGGDRGDTRVSRLTKAQANDSSTGAQGEPGIQL